jgi:uncharacterized protein (DUF2336 family)
MLKALKRLFSGPGKGLTYEEARGALERHDASAKQGLAGDEKAAPEILYFLAGDTDAKVRRKVAANPATPMQANRLLAEDEETDVRTALARKLARLLPDAGLASNRDLGEAVIAMLERLAADRLPQVRAVVAEELKSSGAVPADLIRGLASDMEEIVAAPILEFSPLLSDEDLVQIARAAQASGILEAIAKRRHLGAGPAEAVAAHFEPRSVAALLSNDSAQIREETLDRILERAPEIESWHRPLVERPDLSLAAIRRIAGFAATSLIELLKARSGLDKETATYLAARVRRRIAREGLASREDEKPAADAVALAIDGGRVSETASALAQAAGIPAALAERILESRNPRPAVALCWRAGLKMRAAVTLQTKVLRLPAGEFLPARDGIDYPMTPDEMNGQLELFGIKPR